MDHIAKLREDAQERMQKNGEEIEAAFAVLKKHPDYPQTLLKITEGLVRLRKIERKLPQPAVPSPERLRYALAKMDNLAGSYIGLVTDREMMDAFETILKHMESFALTEYRGNIYLSTSTGNLAAVITTPDEIRDRVTYWRKKYLRRLIQSKLSPSSPPKKAAQSRRGYHSEVRAWMKRNDVTSVRAAAKKLLVGYDVLKSIMSDKGKPRYGPEKLTEVLKKIALPSGE